MISYAAEMSMNTANLLFKIQIKKLRGGAKFAKLNPVVNPSLQYSFRITFSSMTASKLVGIIQLPYTYIPRFMEFLRYVKKLNKDFGCREVLSMQKGLNRDQVRIYCNALSSSNNENSASKTSFPTFRLLLGNRGFGAIGGANIPAKFECHLPVLISRCIVYGCIVYIDERRDVSFDIELQYSIHDSVLRLFMGQFEYGMRFFVCQILGSVNFGGSSNESRKTESIHHFMG